MWIELFRYVDITAGFALLEQEVEKLVRYFLTVGLETPSSRDVAVTVRPSTARTRIASRSDHGSGRPRLVSDVATGLLRY